MTDLIAQWRERAVHIRAYAVDPRGADLWELAASELEHALNQACHEPLTPTQAAQEAGYHPGSMARLIRAKPELNVGTKGRPRILRKDVPRKPAKEGGVGAGSVVEIALASRRR